MKLCLGLVVAAAVCVQMAQGLSCFTCNTPIESSECKEQTNCSALSSKFAVCKTTVMSPEVGFPFTGKEIVFRQCAEQCVPTGLNWLGVTRKILCCNADLCNINGIKTESTNNDNCENNTGTATIFNLVTMIVLVFSAITYSIQ
ncbi:ly6/PLAUR domain-containing protein 2-like [Bufo gargarizans]|uniref:ly6/PLAUR domain-containing protein 2-like n=1 Tax=Bufo gargarizans TaxID=30331 RepID=UPI001CF3C19A|nr:ly6/PLAUR domain-containing protein 2-like [Bufo gargarizans]